MREVARTRSPPATTESGVRPLPKSMFARSPCVCMRTQSCCCRPRARLPCTPSSAWTFSPSIRPSCCRCSALHSAAGGAPLRQACERSMKTCAWSIPARHYALPPPGEGNRFREVKVAEFVAMGVHGRRLCCIVDLSFVRIPAVLVPGPPLLSSNPRSTRWQGRRMWVHEGERRTPSPSPLLTSSYAHPAGGRPVRRTWAPRPSSGMPSIRSALALASPRT